MVRRALAAVAAGLVVVGAAVAAEGLWTVEGTAFRCGSRPSGCLPRADDRPLTDPRTLLVVGTRGVRPIDTECQVASYRVPADGAAVVVIGWKGKLGDVVPARQGGLFAKELERGFFRVFRRARAIAARRSISWAHATS